MRATMDAMDAVAEMMRRTGMRPADLARSTSKSPQNINKIVNRDVSDMRVSNLALVARAMGYRLVLDGEGEPIELD